MHIIICAYADSNYLLCRMEAFRCHQNHNSRAMMIA